MLFFLDYLLLLNTQQKRKEQKEKGHCFHLPLVFSFTLWVENPQTSPYLVSIPERSLKKAPKKTPELWGDFCWDGKLQEQLIWISSINSENVHLELCTCTITMKRHPQWSSETMTTLEKEVHLIYPDRTGGINAGLWRLWPCYSVQQRKRETHWPVRCVLFVYCEKSAVRHLLSEIPSPLKQHAIQCMS